MWKFLIHLKPRSAALSASYSPFDPLVHAFARAFGNCVSKLSSFVMNCQIMGRAVIERYQDDRSARVPRRGAEPNDES
jgi:hypothetical protein